MEHVDVAIVGGGPAGASAAEHAAANGADTVCFEQGVPREDRPDIGPDSTDAAGMLDYWIDIMGFDYTEIPDEIILQEFNAVDFFGPTSHVELRTTGIKSSYPHMGYTFHRARMDDWLHERATEAGADMQVGSGVKSVTTDFENGTHRHTVRLASGDELKADTVILADGPQRRVTLETLDQFMPATDSMSNYLSPPVANHIAYQEYREFPPELFDADRLKFWWGVIPGETAYPWIFPNDGTVGRVGLTMPIGMDLSDVAHPESYALLSPEDSTIPNGSTYIRRLLKREYGDEYDIESDMPIIENRGKSKGTETYPISSTRPIESPTSANIAVAGGAMGTTSAFHEGGYHLAVRSGKIAGRLAANGHLERYNDTWKQAIGSEIRRNVAFADLVTGYEPDDWDWAFNVANKMIGDRSGDGLISRRYTAGYGAAKVAIKYALLRRKYRDGRYVQLRESDYVV